MYTNYIEFGDCIKTMKRWSKEGVKAQMCVTSPPYYGLRDYGEDGQIGLEETPDHYVAKLVVCFRSVRRLLHDNGTLWLNLGDSYFVTTQGAKGGSNKQRHNAGSSFTFPTNLSAGYRDIKRKDLMGIPWHVAFALQADGWYLRQDIIWHKPNVMPESVTDRCTKSHEYIFLLSKSAKYYFDYKAIKEPTVTRDALVRDRTSARLNNTPGRRKMGGLTTNNYKSRNKRSVWAVNTKSFKGAHFATFPPALIEPCILAGSSIGDVVLDPFMGSGTTAMVALQHGRNYLGCELNNEYAAMQQMRILADDEKLLLP